MVSDTKKLVEMKSYMLALLTITLILLPNEILNVVAQDPETTEEPSLKQWLIENGYNVNVTTDKTGIETFPPGNYRVTILSEIADYALNNTFGWYPLTTGINNELFSGQEITEAIAEFSSADDFGLYLGSPDGIFHTETNLNTDDFDHVWIFIDPKTQDGMIIAWEDLWEGGDEDFQDMIIAMQLLPPPPPTSEFAVKIEDEWTLPEDEYGFNAPTFCKTFKAEVQIVNVLNLFGYEYWLEFDPTLIKLSEYEIEHIHEEDLITLEEVNNSVGLYKQAVTAKAPSETYNGSAPVTILWFHTIKDPCYPYNYTGVLKLKNTKMSDPHENPIVHGLRDGYFRIQSAKPKMSIQHEGETDTMGWIVNETFTLEVVITNILKMRGFFMRLGWCESLETDHQNVNVTTFLPPPYQLQTTEVNATVLTVYVETFVEKPAINGTGTILRVTFKVRNPWGHVPPYRIVEGRYLPESYTCRIWILDGWIDVYCPEHRRMYLYNSSYGVSVENDFNYTFTPIPGDLNLDGQVNIVDLGTISRWMDCESGDPEWAECFCLDLNSDLVIDIFDIVIVATNIGRTHP